MIRPAIHVRLATPDDVDLIASFNVAMASETEGKSLDLEIVRRGTAAGLGDAIRSLYFIAEMDDGRVGQTMVTLEWSDWRNGYFWWIQSVYVVPRARRRGVFRALYQHVRGEAKRRGDVCGLRLYAHRRNRGALATYHSLGMATTDYIVVEEEWSAE